MNLAYKYPIMFWNCACLISDAGGAESQDEESEESDEEVIEESYDCQIEEFGTDDEDDDEDDDEEDEDEEDKKEVKKKKKVKASDYGKIASAIGKITSTGVSVIAPDINKSSFTFSPDIQNNAIRYGLSGITRIGNDLIKQIINSRPYTSVNDFLDKVKVNKPQMVNLIKAGAFDSFGDRIEVMHNYINLISDAKKRITLQNMKMLIDYNLIDDKYDLQRRVFNFNKYIKKAKKDNYYELDEASFNFYNNNFDVDKLEVDESTESGFKIKQLTWDTIYTKQMDIIRPWIKANAADLLVKLNNKLTESVWNKYCLGSISKWEMDSLSCYCHEHELKEVNNYYYELSDFSKLPKEPEIDYVANFKGKSVPIYRLRRIAGTVLERNKAKKTVTLLTTSGVVTVKIYGNQFANYDKQISNRDANGTKHVERKSEFSRGNKIIVTGIRQEEAFLAKKYKSTEYHLLETIEQINDDGTIETFSRND